MSEQLVQAPQEGLDKDHIGSLGKITVLEALAEDTIAISPNMSNASTVGPNIPDPDDA